MGRYDNLVEKIKTINTEEVKDWYSNMGSDMKVIEEQKIYIWIRLFLKEESNVEIGDNIFMTYTPSGEKLETKFICYGKTGLSKDHDDLEKITNFNPEDDKKVLCLMIDEDRININNEDIPFIKTLFKIGRFYEKQVWRKVDMGLIDGDGNELPWFDIDF